MRSETEMMNLILGVASADERVRAVVLNGSRANPAVPRDKYQDYDIVYLVTTLQPFTADHSWIDVFGERLILQMPEAMREPSGAGHFNWMMLFADGNRLDLTLVPLAKRALVLGDSLSVTLLDKDGLLPAFPPPSDRGYWVQPPSALFYASCCNNFWWCLQNVAKGLARDEMPHALQMLNTIVRTELHDMMDWYIGVENDFAVTPGKMGKYYAHYLPAGLYRQYIASYGPATTPAVWGAVYDMCDLFHTLALRVAGGLGFVYRQDEEDGMRTYLAMLRQGG